MAAGGAWLMHASIDPAEEAGAGVIETSRRDQLAGVASWGYQLQGLVAGEAARSGFDLLVVDETLDGSRRPERRADVLKSLKIKPDGGRRLVLAYLSIGEAEDYRAYWDKSWIATSGAVPQPARASEPSILAASPAYAGPATSPGQPVKPLRQPTALAPSWLGEENREWRGNFRVKFWEDGWQRLMLGSDRAALDRLIAEGFDGVYLDRADVFQLWSRERGGAREDMIHLIARLSEHARRKSPDFIIVMQNAEELLGSHAVRGAIDAIAKEDLLYGIDGGERANSERDVAASLKYLTKAHRSGLPVLVVEYVSDRATIAATRKRIGDLGFIPHFATRALNQLGPAQ